ncbi:MAG: CpsB/CapC family capsule biosynthesis tyrosine phosphatase, partial [Sphaerochaetaceae bacterium]|nr:CpsB/CapC family capsule biosynthesis tyrosine phosphatase [Sphaerochaetaceae bacterium]
PFVDDGVQSKEQCLSVLGAYKQAGFDRVVVTPHLYNPYVSTRTANIRLMYQWAAEEAAKMGLKLFLGSEIFIGSIHPEHILPFMSRFALVVLDYYTKPLFLEHYNYILLKRGYHVILAHVERYQWFSPKDPLAKKIKELGVHFQCNVDGVESGAAAKWINSGMIDVIACDNHGNTGVPEKLATLLRRYPDISAKMNSLFIDDERIQ